MKRKKAKALLIPILIFVLAIIWFFNVRFITKIKTHMPESTDVQSVSAFSAESLAVSDFKFKPLKRDPFNIIIDTGPKEPVMPKLSLKGVVLTEDGALALMELADGNVYTMKQGEKYLGVTIKKITPKQVIVEFRGRKVTFEVWQ